MRVVALVAFLAVVVREIAGMFRERRIEKLREAAIDAIAVKDHEAAKRVVRDLITLYGERTHTAAGRKRLTAWADEIIEADDRIALAERELVAPLDLAAKRAVAGAAKQVSVVTAVSPRAIVDVAFVIFAAVRLLRRISMIYGGRPGLLGFLRLARAAFGHLAVTGGVAVGDSIVQQVLGLGLAARISAKLGEGVLNGLMTARFGLAAIAVCRPLPFLREEPPRLGDVAGELLGGARGGGAGPLRSFPPLFGARLRHRAAGRAVGLWWLSPKSRGVGRRTNSIYFLLEPFGVPAVRSGAALSGLTLAPRVRIAPARSAFFSPRPPRLVGGRVSAPDPGLARGFGPGEVGRVRPSPDPLPALQGGPAVVRGER